MRCLFLGARGSTLSEACPVTGTSPQLEMMRFDPHNGAASLLPYFGNVHANVESHRSSSQYPMRTFCLEVQDEGSCIFLVKILMQLFFKCLCGHLRKLNHLLSNCREYLGHAHPLLCRREREGARLYEIENLQRRKESPCIRVISPCTHRIQKERTSFKLKLAR